MPDDQRPPEGMRTISQYAAARRLGVYTSSVEVWVAGGFIVGGKYKVPGRVQRVGWCSEADVQALINEGGRWNGIKKRREARNQGGKDNA